MITVSQESWVSLAAIGAFAIALFGYLRNISKDLKTEIGTTRTELKGDIASLDDKLDKTRTELKGDIGAIRTELKGDIASLDDKLDKTRAELVGALTGGFAKVEARLINLEQRTYDISTRLPAAPASTSTP